MKDKIRPIKIKELGSLIILLSQLSPAKKIRGLIRVSCEKF